MAEQRVGAPGRRLPRRLAVLAVLAAYAGGAWLLYAPLGLLDRTQLPTCPCRDLAQQAWLLALGRSWLASGHLSLLTHQIDLPRGVDVADTASFPLLVVLAAPLTATVGPVATLGLLFRIGVLATAGSTFGVLRRLGRTLTGAAVGGAVFAFGPFMFHQAGNHMFLVFLPLAPVLLLLVIRQVAAGRDRAVRRGLLLGATATAQFFIDPEVLLSLGLVATLTLLVLGLAAWVRREPRLTAVWSGMWRLALAGGAVLAPLVAYPAWEALAGPQHITGATQPSGLGIPPLATLLAAGHTVVGGLGPLAAGPRLLLEGDTAYLGVPLLGVAVVVVAVLARSVRQVQAAAGFGVLAWVLALGPHLLVGDRATRLSLPFDLLTRVPVLQDLVPSRLTLEVDLAAALLVAIGTDRLLLAARTRRGPLPARALASVVLVCAVASVLPGAAVGVAGIGVARLFTQPGFLGHLSPGRTVLTTPAPSYPADAAMLWQAESGMRFRLVGGYADRPRPDGAATKQPLLPEPSAVPAAMLTGGREPLSPRELGSARYFLPRFVRRWHIAAILVALGSVRGHQVAHLVTRIYGAPARYHGLDAWWHLRRHRRSVSV